MLIGTRLAASLYLREPMKQIILVVATVIAVPFTDARAQAIVTRFGLEAATYYATVDGDDVEGVDPGFGFDLQGRISWPVWSIGLGWQRSAHEIDELETDLVSTAFFIEPRYEFRSPGSMRPYLLVRGGWAKDRFSGDFVGFGPAEVETSGWLIGLGAGIAWAVSPGVDVTVSSTWTRDSFGDATLNGETVEDTKSQASHLSVRLGALILFPRR